MDLTTGFHLALKDEINEGMKRRKESLQKLNRKIRLMFVFFLAHCILVTNQEEKCFPVWAIFLLDHSYIPISFSFDEQEVIMNFPE